MRIRPRTPSPAALAVLVSLLASAAAMAAFDIISVDEEWSMRGQLHAEVAQKMPLVNDPAALDYLNRLGRQIAAQTPYGNRRWDFFIVRDDAVNAFNLPGGLVYVNSGLIKEARSLDELTGAMAHEIGHGAARHGTQLMTKAYGYNLIARLAMGRHPGQGRQLLAGLVGNGILNHYSRDAERAADRLGVHYAYQSGYDPRGMLDLFADLQKLQGRQPLKVEQFFSNHPLTRERIQNVSAEIATLPRNAALTRDSRDYQQFRARVH
ncbi:MAG TPA: M48 family metallopeptidase [Thermoanaerobaculia bacterium]|jgi:predicted Zn-dependent protease|nr:M48 family metallopeptidase [Thermoanaerobaculia bacterium]